MMSSPTNGQVLFPAVIGDILAWKNLQKIPKKNHTSLNRNQINPHFSLAATRREWLPWNTLSRETSRVHKKKIITAGKNKTQLISLKHPFRKNKRLIIIKNVANLICKGHQLFLIKCDCCHLIKRILTEKKVQLPPEEKFVTLRPWENRSEHEESNYEWTTWRRYIKEL